MSPKSKSVFLRLVLPFLFLGPITITSLYGEVWLKHRDLTIRKQAIEEINLQEREARERLRALVSAMSFEDIMVYYSIFPPEKVVGLSAPARYVSDSEIDPVVEGIPGGVRIDWYETIYCDLKPFDGVPIFTYYQEAASTGSVFIEAVPRKGELELQDSPGWPVNKPFLHPETGDKVPLLYPSRPSDCYIISRMLMSFPGLDLVPKTYLKRSEVVLVRGPSEELAG